MMTRSYTIRFDDDRRGNAKLYDFLCDVERSDDAKFVDADDADTAEVVVPLTRDEVESLKSLVGSMNREDVEIELAD